MIWPAEDLWQDMVPFCPGLTVEILPQIDSTNTELMRRARAGQLDPVLLVAETQTAGRGRLGRPWLGQAGHTLMFSLGLLLQPNDWSGLSLAVGLSIAQSLDPHHQSGIALKWPNDLWVSRPNAPTPWHKLAGILIETAVPSPAPTLAPRSHAFHTSLGPARYCVVGVGLNMVAPEASGLSTPPVGLSELDPQQDAPSALRRIAPALLRMMLDFETSGFAPWRQAFHARDALHDQAVRLSSGEQGWARGVDEQGAMLVEINGQLQAVISSEISVRPVL